MKKDSNSNKFWKTIFSNVFIWVVIIFIALSAGNYFNNFSKVKEVSYTEYKEYVKYETMHLDLNTKENDIRGKVNSANILKEKIQEAESLAIQNVIQNLNTFLDSYLQIFFEENPMTIQLSAFKDDKGISKPQITIYIEYK